MTTPADQIIGIYRRHAQTWATRRNTALFERPWLRRFEALLPENPHILDLGAGAGQPIAAWFLAQEYELTGVDAAPEMTRIAQDQYPQATWITADMRGLHLDRHFDGMLAWDSFFHLTGDDQRRMFPVFARHAAPGAALMFTSGTGEGVAMGEFEGEPLFHASLSPEEYRTLLDRHGFDVVDHRAEDPECAQHTIWLARFRGPA